MHPVVGHTAMPMNSSDCSCEPMDVDMSFNSTISLDVSSNKLQQRDIRSKKDEGTLDDLQTSSDKGNIEWKIKKFHLKREPKKKVMKYAIALVVFCFSAIGYYATDTSCMKELQLNLIEQALTTKLYGQKLAVEQVMKTLKVATSSKIFFFYGGTGVGKTYTTSLILKESWNYSNIYHFTMPSFVDTFTTNLLSGLILCKSTVMVVDNLNQNDDKVSTHIKAIIEKSEYLSKNLTIFLIFNCDTVSTGFIRKCDSTFIDKLQESYRETKALKSFIKFETLTEEILRKCIQDEIGYKAVSEVKMSEILKHFDVSSDGCKGVHTKMKFLDLL